MRSHGELIGLFAGKIGALGPNRVPSGFVKHKLPGRAQIEALGIVGDEQADLTVHGGVDKAVYAYPAVHYPKWAEGFPAPNVVWQPGALGENLALDHSDESEVCVGDLVRLGSALLQVTQPRKPCFKMALRFDDTRLPRAMVVSGRCGWYYRVVEPGWCQLGDVADLVDRPHAGWTIQRLTTLSRQRDAAPTALEELAALPELSGAWREQTVAAIRAAQAGVDR